MVTGTPGRWACLLAGAVHRARFIEARTDLTRTPAEATKCAALEVRRAQRGALKVLQLDSTKLHECALEGNHGREQEQHP